MSEILCPACKTANEEGSAFCMNCGEKLDAVTTSPAVETKQEAVFLKGEEEAESTDNNNHKPRTLLIVGLVLMVVSAVLVFALKGKKLPGISGAKPEKEVYLFRLSGSNSLGEVLMTDLVTRYLTEVKKATNIKLSKGRRPGDFIISGVLRDETLVKVLIRVNGSLSGLRHLSVDSADIGMSSLRVSELETFQDSLRRKFLLAENEFHICNDAAIIAVNPANPLRNLSKDQLTGILDGRISRWSDLGVNIEGEIQLILPDSLSGTWSLLQSRTLKTSGSSLRVGTVRLFNHDSIARFVYTNRNALGILSYANKHSNNLVALKTLSGNVMPGTYTISRNEYPLSRRLYLYADYQQMKPDAKAFFDYCKGPGQSRAVNRGFIGNEIFAMPSTLDIELTDSIDKFTFDKVKPLMTIGRCLNISIHFDASGIVLEPGEQARISRAAQFLLKPENLGKTVYVIGFSDPAAGYSGSNLEASLSRARVVEKYLTEFGIKPVTVGLGGASPIGWADSPDADWLNRRVQIWVK